MAFAVLAFPLLTHTVLGQSNELGPLMDRIERMQRDIRTINTRLARGERPPVSSVPATAVQAGKTIPGPAVARISQRLADMEDEIRASTGRMEKLSFRVDQLSRRLEKLAGDVEFRLNVLERRGIAPRGTPKISAAPSPPSVREVAPGGGISSPPRILGKISKTDLRAAATAGDVHPSVASARPAPSNPPVSKKDAELAAYANILPKGSVKDRYNYAIGLLRKTDYSGAEKALRAFIAVDGKNPLANNARYWLGETFYVRGEFEQAAQIFLASYQADTKGAKAPDSLLKLGMSLNGLKKKREACAAFGKLKKDYPDASPAIKKTLERQLKRDACK
jgi:tol-pal system protein YbgF